MLLQTQQRNLTQLLTSRKTWNIWRLAIPLVCASLGHSEQPLGYNNHVHSPSTSSNVLDDRTLTTSRVNTISVVRPMRHKGTRKRARDDKERNILPTGD